MKKAYLKLVRFVAVVENILCSVCLIAATVLTFAQVLNRYWLHYEIMWLSDLVLYLFVFGVFLIIAMTTREDTHTVVDILEQRFFTGPVLKSVCKICVHICTLAILCVTVPIFHTYFRNALNFPEYGTLVRWFNTSWLIVTLFVMFLLCVFHTLHNLGVHIFALRASLAETKERTA